MKKAIIIGTGGHAKVTADAARLDPSVEVVGFLAKEASNKRPSDSVSVIGQDRELTDLMAKYEVTHGIVAVGNNALRAEIVARLREEVPALQWTTAVHPAAVVASDVHLGEGTVVMAGAILNPGTVVGDHCIVNTSASLDHGNVLGDFVNIAPGVVTGGDVHIGEGTIIGVGAAIKPGVRIGKNAVIGAGAVVVKDIEDQALAYGVPAEPKGQRKPGESYT